MPRDDRYTREFKTDDPNELDSSGVITRLGTAAVYGDVGEVKRLLAMPHADPNKGSDDPRHSGFGALGALACYSSFGRTAKLLVDDPRTDIDRRDRKGRTPFLTAAEFGHVEVLREIAKKADIHVRGAGGENALELAAVNGKLPCVKHLATILDPKGAGPGGLTPLMRAAASTSPKSVAYLLGLSDLSARCERGWSPAMHAAANGRLETLSVLIAHFDPLERDPEGRTALDLFHGWRGDAENASAKKIEELLAAHIAVASERKFIEEAARVPRRLGAAGSARI